MLKPSMCILQYEKKCNRTFNKQLNVALRNLQIPALKAHYPYLRLLFSTLAKMNIHMGMVWYSMAYLRDADWQKYSKMIPKDRYIDPALGCSVDVFSLDCPLLCCNRHHVGTVSQLCSWGVTGSGGRGLRSINGLRPIQSRHFECTQMGS